MLFTPGRTEMTLFSNIGTSVLHKISQSGSTNVNEQIKLRLSVLDSHAYWLGINPMMRLAIGDIEAVPQPRWQIFQVLEDIYSAAQGYNFSFNGVSAVQR